MSERSQSSGGIDARAGSDITSGGGEAGEAADGARTGGGTSSAKMQRWYAQRQVGWPSTMPNREDGDQ